MREYVAKVDVDLFALVREYPDFFACLFIVALLCPLGFIMLNWDKMLRELSRSLVLHLVGCGIYSTIRSYFHSALASQS